MMELSTLPTVKYLKQEAWNKVLKAPRGRMSSVVPDVSLIILVIGESDCAKWEVGGSTPPFRAWRERMGHPVPWWAFACVMGYLIPWRRLVGRWWVRRV